MGLIIDPIIEELGHKAQYSCMLLVPLLAALKANYLCTQGPLALVGLCIGLKHHKLKIKKRKKRVRGSKCYGSEVLTT